MAVMGPIERELRERCTAQLSPNDEIGLTLAFCGLSEPAVQGFIGHCGWSPDAWSEAIEAAEALGL